MARLRASMFLSVGALLCIIGLIFAQLRGLAVIGVISILIGLIKTTFSYMRTSKKSTHNTQPANKEAQPPQQTKRCFVCSAQNNAQANFCGHCGHKLQ